MFFAVCRIFRQKGGFCLLYQIYAVCQEDSSEVDGPALCGVWRLEKNGGQARHPDCKILLYIGRRILFPTAFTSRLDTKRIFMYNNKVFQRKIVNDR